MLRACRRLLRPEGQIAFATIAIAPDLSKKDHRRAARLGPRSVSSTRPIGDLVGAAGFEEVEVTDVTKDFVETLRAWFKAFNTNEAELRSLLGERFDERQRGRRDMIDATGEGLLQRLVVDARAPSD